MSTLFVNLVLGEDKSSVTSLPFKFLENLVLAENKSFDKKDSSMDVCVCVHLRKREDTCNTEKFCVSLTEDCAYLSLRLTHLLTCKHLHEREREKGYLYLRD